MTHKKNVGFKGYYQHFKVANEPLFIECCRLRYMYDEQEATPLQWQELAVKFQEAKGTQYSCLAEYCMRKAKV